MTTTTVKTTISVDELMFVPFGEEELRLLAVEWSATLGAKGVTTTAMAYAADGSTLVYWPAWRTGVDGLPSWVPPAPAWFHEAAREMAE